MPALCFHIRNLDKVSYNSNIPQHGSGIFGLSGKHAEHARPSGVHAFSLLTDTWTSKVPKTMDGISLVLPLLGALETLWGPGTSPVVPRDRCGLVQDLVGTKAKPLIPDRRITFSSVFLKSASSSFGTEGNEYSRNMIAIDLPVFVSYSLGSMLSPLIFGNSHIHYRTQIGITLEDPGSHHLQFW